MPVSGCQPLKDYCFQRKQGWGETALYNHLTAFSFNGQLHPRRFFEMFGYTDYNKKL
jgi:hypothetical protein